MGTICNEKDHLKMILFKTQRYEAMTYFLTVHYGSKNNYGRVYPFRCASLGMLRRPIRHFIAEGLYYDIDMINAHFMIMLGLCNRCNYKKIKKIKNYINNRELTLKKYMLEYGMTRDKVKTMFIAMLNGGKISYFLEKNSNTGYVPDSYLKGFEKECSNVCDRFMEEVKSHTPESIYHILTERHILTQEKRRSFMSKYLQIEEEKILKIFYGLAVKKKSYYLWRKQGYFMSRWSYD